MLDTLALSRLLERELAEDRAADDVTSRLLGEEGTRPATAGIRAKEVGVFYGTAVVRALCDLRLGLLGETLIDDGDVFRRDEVVVRLGGPLATLLSVERTLLNLLSHLSGVATFTRKHVEAVKHHGTTVLATRKTLPGLRALQLAAVEAGGGRIHRRSLSDGILAKDNHVSVVPGPELVRRARKSRSPLHRIEVEVQSLPELESLLTNPPDVVMLDNFSLEDIRVAMQWIAGRCEVEVSGGVTLATIGDIAATGVQYVSVGRLTHSAPSIDLSLDIERPSA